MGRQRYTAEQQAFYKAYLNSPFWRATRDARIAEADGQCEWVIHDFDDDTRIRCPRKTFIQCHHNNYKRLGNELRTDLDVFCWEHHMLEHLLWKRCECRAPCLGDVHRGAKWLALALKTLKIDLDDYRTSWSDLPDKEYLLAEIPNQCPECRHYWSKD